MAFVIDPQPRYCAYLLRCWEARGQEGATWRFSVEDAHTGARRGFSGLEGWVAFLQPELAGRSEVPDSRGGVRALPGAHSPVGAMLRRDVDGSGA